MNVDHLREASKVIYITPPFHSRLFFENSELDLIASMVLCFRSWFPVRFISIFNSIYALQYPYPMFFTPLFFLHTHIYFVSLPLDFKQTPTHAIAHPNLITRRQRMKILVLLPNRPLNGSRQMSRRQLVSLNPRETHIPICRLSTIPLLPPLLRRAGNLQKPSMRQQMEVKARIPKLHHPLRHRRVFIIKSPIEVGEQIRFLDEHDGIHVVVVPAC